MRKTKLTKDEQQEMVQSYKSELRMLEFELERVNSAISALEKMTPLKEKAVKTRGPKKKRGRPRKEESAKTAKKKPGRKRGRPAKKSAVATPKSATSQGKKGKRGRPRKIEAATVKAPKKKTAKRSNFVKKKPQSGVKINKASGKKAISKPAKESKISVWEKFILETMATTNKELIKSDLFLFAKTSDSGISAGLGDKEINQQLSNALRKLMITRGIIAKTYHLGRGDAFALKEWLDKNGEILPAFKR